MARSIRSLALFRSREDYETFFLLLKKTREKYPFAIHSYCLMTTHFHLLVSTFDTEIWKIMKYLMYSYAMYFNQRYGTRGHVFDSRYVSCLIEDERYFLEVSRYIHLNPVKAGMVHGAADYEYSSYPSILAGKNSEILEPGDILNRFRGDQTAQYRIFVESMASHQENEAMIQREMMEDEKWLPW